MAAGRVIAEPGDPSTAPIAAQQIGRYSAFIKEHVLAHIAERQARVPLPPGCDHIRPSLLVGVDGFLRSSPISIQCLRL